MHSFLHRSRGSGDVIADSFTEVGDKILGSWQAPLGGGGQEERFMVLTVHEGRIVDMQGFTDRRKAERFANCRV